MLTPRTQLAPLLILFIVLLTPICKADSTLPVAPEIVALPDGEPSDSRWLSERTASSVGRVLPSSDFLLLQGGELVFKTRTSSIFQSSVPETISSQSGTPAAQNILLQGITTEAQTPYDVGRASSYLATKRIAFLPGALIGILLGTWTRQFFRRVFGKQLSAFPTYLLALFVVGILASEIAGLAAGGYPRELYVDNATDSAVDLDFGDELHSVLPAATNRLFRISPRDCPLLVTVAQGADSLLGRAYVITMESEGKYLINVRGANQYRVRRCYYASAEMKDLR